MDNKHMRRHSTSLVIREIQIKTAAICSYTPTEVTIIKKADANKIHGRERSRHCCGGHVPPGGNGTTTLGKRS